MSIFEIKTEEGKVIVSATLAPYNPSRTPRKKVATSDVESHLKENDVKFGKCIQDCSLNNREPSALSGVWIFENKAENTLDKPAEKVILSKEKKTLPNKISKAKKKDK